MNDARPNPEGNQMQRRFRGLGKFPVPDKRKFPGLEKIKGSRGEFHQKRNTITCRYATLDTLIHSITTAISPNLQYGLSSTSKSWK